VTNIVMQAGDIDRALTRISFEILEANKGPDDLVLLGIPTRGVPLAERLAAKIAKTETGVDPKTITGAVDITMYRDDLHGKPLKHTHPTRIPLSGIDGKVVVLVDDVLFSGRSVRAALDAIGELGRPAWSSSPCSSIGAPRAADSGGLRGQEPAHVALRAGQRASHTA
jgi:pyrimidine operon attenuation protein / uracil phosphoribosyltransferase